jgi:hypothetical protein
MDRRTLLKALLGVPTVAAMPGGIRQVVRNHVVQYCCDSASGHPYQAIQ